MINIDTSLLTAFAIAVIIVLAIGSAGTVWATRKVSDWLDAMREMKVIAQQKKIIASKNRELKLIRHQNILLKEDLEKTNKLYQELKIAYEVLQKENKAVKYLLEENQKANKELSRKLNLLEADYEDFKDSIGDFMVEALKADRAAVDKLLKLKK